MFRTEEDGFSAMLMGTLPPYFSSYGHVGGASLLREMSCRDC